MRQISRVLAYSQATSLEPRVEKGRNTWGFGGRYGVGRDAVAKKISLLEKSMNGWTVELS